MNQDDLPKTFREVGIYLRGIKEDFANLKNEDLKEIKDEVDEIKKSINKMMGVVFTALIAPILVGIILTYIVKVQ